MDFSEIEARGLVLLGCGKMGSAMLAGWLAEGLSASAVTVLDPKPSDWLLGLDGLRLNAALPPSPAIVIVAVKPQMMEEALGRLAGLSDTVLLSIAAGISINSFEARFGAATSIIRAMPNTPAAIGRGITALIGNDATTSAQLDMAQALLAAVGETVRLESEAQMDAVTAVSGSGPAYVFHLIETLAAAGEAQGLPPELAMRLAKTTVGGAGALALEAAEAPAQLRINVTSPAGTTAAALEVLMQPETGFPALLTQAVKAAADRSRELGQ